MEQKFKLASVVNDTGGTTTFDAYDFVGMIAKTDEDIGNPTNPVHSSIVVDVAQDNTLVEIHLDAELLKMIDLVQDLTVKLFTPNKQEVTLDGGEINFAKALIVGIEFEYQGDIFYQEHRIGLSKKTNANIFASYPIPNPALFSDTIIVQYNNTNNKVTIQTTGSGVPSIIKIIDVKGVF